MEERTTVSDIPLEASDTGRPEGGAEVSHEHAIAWTTSGGGESAATDTETAVSPHSNTSTLSPVNCLVVNSDGTLCQVKIDATMEEMQEGACEGNTGEVKQGTDAAHAPAGILEEAQRGKEESLADQRLVGQDAPSEAGAAENSKEGGEITQEGEEEIPVMEEVLACDAGVVEERHPLQHTFAQPKGAKHEEVQEEEEECASAELQVNEETQSLRDAVAAARKTIKAHHHPQRDEEHCQEEEKEKEGMQASRIGIIEKDTETVAAPLPAAAACTSLSPLSAVTGAGTSVGIAFPVAEATSNPAATTSSSATAHEGVSSGKIALQTENEGPHKDRHQHQHHHSAIDDEDEEDDDDEEDDEYQPHGEGGEVPTTPGGRRRGRRGSAPPPLLDLEEYCDAAALEGLTSLRETLLSIFPPAVREAQLAKFKERYATVCVVMPRTLAAVAAAEVAIGAAMKGKPSTAAEKDEGIEDSHADGAKTIAAAGRASRKRKRVEAAPPPTSSATATPSVDPVALPPLPPSTTAPPASAMPLADLLKAVAEDKMFLRGAWSRYYDGVRNRKEQLKANRRKHKLHGYVVYRRPAKSMTTAASSSGGGGEAGGVSGGVSGSCSGGGALHAGAGLSGEMRVPPSDLFTFAHWRSSAPAVGILGKESTSSASVNTATTAASLAIETAGSRRQRRGTTSGGGHVPESTVTAGISMSDVISADDAKVFARYVMSSGKLRHECPEPFAFLNARVRELRARLEGGE